MKRRFGLVLLLTGALLSSSGASVAVAHPATAPEYSVTAIGIQPNAINDVGIVAGVSGDRAALWFAGHSTDLGTLPGDATSDALAINDLGEVAGFSRGTFPAPPRAVLWKYGHVTPLATLPGGSNSSAFAINLRGQIVGYSSTNSPPGQHAVMWDDGRISDLGTLPNATPELSQAQSVNIEGQVVGWSYTSAGQVHAVTWNRGHIKDLGTLPGGTASQANGINRRGQIVGWAVDGNGVHAVVWDANGITKLESLTAATSDYSFAYGINDWGQVIGTTHIGTPEGPLRAAVWNDGKITELPLLPGQDMGQANALNDRGQIVGLLLSASGGIGPAALWQPTP